MKPKSKKKDNHVDAMEEFMKNLHKSNESNVSAAKDQKQNSENCKKKSVEAKESGKTK